MTELSPETAEAITRHTLELTSAALAPLLASLDLVSDDRLAEQPVPEQMPIGKMIEHALGAVAFTSRSIRLGKCDESDVADLNFDDDTTGTRSRIREIEGIARSELAAVLAALDAEMAQRKISYWFGWEMTGLQTAGLGHQELIHHRGQVQSLLRLMGYTPPDIYAPAQAAEEALAE